LLMRTAAVITILAGALIASAVAAILVGAVAIAPGDVVGALLGSDTTNGTIIRELRLPRVLGAALVGAALAGAGAMLQGLLRNPLADPFVTGTSAGASLGAVIAIALGASATIVPLASFAGAMVAIAVVWRLARLGGRTTVLTVLLAGVVLTSFAGLIGSAGLVIPHALRFVVGATHRRLVLASLPAGAIALVLADLGARTLISPAELPVGVITGLVGAPFFLLLLVRSRQVIV